MSGNNRSRFRRISREQILREQILKKPGVKKNPDFSDSWKNYIPLENVDNPILNNKRISNMSDETYSSFSDETKEYFKYLEKKTGGSNGDNGIPFFVPYVDINTVNDLIDYAEKKKEEVLKVYTKKVEKNISSGVFDIVTIIPFRSRYKHIISTIDSLIKSQISSGINVKIVVVENSAKPILDSVKDRFADVDYVWIDSCGFLFNKCLSHNIGAYLTDSDYLHFHDCDLLVPENFYIELLKNVKSKRCIQCFDKRRVNYIQENASFGYFDGEDINKIIFESKSFREGTEGAPGGSICIERDIFNKVGGFDSHFFWSYSIEDAFFWHKIEKINRFSILDNPPIELYHLWHPPCTFINPNHYRERQVFEKVKKIPDLDPYMKKSWDIHLEIAQKIA